MVGVLYLMGIKDDLVLGDLRVDLVEGTVLETASVHKTRHCQYLQRILSDCSVLAFGFEFGHDAG